MDLWKCMNEGSEALNYAVRKFSYVCSTARLNPPDAEEMRVEGESERGENEHEKVMS